MLHRKKNSRFKRRLILKDHKIKMALKVNNKKGCKKFLKDISDEQIIEFANTIPKRFYPHTEDKWRSLWMSFDWPEILNRTFKIQEQIYALSLKEPLAKSKIHLLQENIITSSFSKLLSVKRVAQDSSGKKTAGVDGVHSLSHKQMIALAYSLTIDGNSFPVKRIYIPKPGTTEQRPLGIPTLLDRAKQALVKLAIEPVWEAKFEETSYGFRPGRSAHDAIWRIWNVLFRAPRWILDGDIEKCFDKIDHDYLMNKLDLIPNSIMYIQIRNWLKAGIMEPSSYIATPNEKGTPQGGVISPLLSNIALHGMMESCSLAVQNQFGKYATKYLQFIRYADDFIVIALKKEHIDAARTGIDQFLSRVGLNIKEAKTKVLFTDEKNSSFNFLGMSFKRISVGSKHKTIKINKESKSTHRLSIVPSEKATRVHFSQLKEIIRTSSSSTIIVRRLNPVIRGWVNYFSCSTLRTSKYIGKFNTRLWKLLINWQKRTYGHRRKILSLWTSVKGDKWVFYSIKDAIKETKTYLFRYGEGSYSVRNYIPVKGTKSPFDGDFLYWGQRLSTYAKSNDLHISLLKRQKFLCTVCKKPFYYNNGDEIYHVDHIIGKAIGGSDSPKNLQVLHPHCHELKTSIENRKSSKKGILRGPVDIKIWVRFPPAGEKLNQFWATKPSILSSRMKRISSRTVSEEKD